MKRYSPIVTSFDDERIELGYIEDKEGNWACYLESQEIIENLEERIIQLEAECRILMEMLGK